MQPVGDVNLPDLVPWPVPNGAEDLCEIPLGEFSFSLPH